MIQNDEKRVVKVGRKALVPPLSYHWALQVGELWYEIAPMAETKNGNKIDTNYGSVAASSAGSMGGSVVGETLKTDEEIDEWNRMWLADHPEYHLLTDNCQKYVFDLMTWLTDNNYHLDIKVNAGNIKTEGDEYWTNDGFTVETDGATVAHYVVGKSHDSVGPLNAKTAVGEFTVEALAGPGYGAFVDATIIEAEASVGNAIGVSVGLSVDTGIGVREGNVEAHIVGFGGKVGADGVEVNTPVVGVSCCCNVL